MCALVFLPLLIKALLPALLTYYPPSKDLCPNVVTLEAQGSDIWILG